MMGRVVEKEGERKTMEWEKAEEIIFKIRRRLSEQIGENKLIKEGFPRGWHELFIDDVI